jgi:hypothetical protein
MSEKKVMRRLGLACCLLATGLLVASCSNDDNPVDSTGAPELPPQSSFIMDYNDFQDGGESSISPGKIADRMGTYWARAALLVGVWNVVLTVTLAVPAASFVEAFAHQPVRQPDGSWEWSYNFMAGGVTHTAVLNGNVVGEEVLWTMTISRVGGFTDFVWYTGVSKLDGSEGTWTLNHDPTNATPFLYIEWEYDVANSTGNLRYTNIVSGGADYGSYIYYGSTTGASYDRFYDLYGVQQNHLVRIEWNYSSKAGRIQDENFYGDDDWRCWDGNLVNFACP